MAWNWDFWRREATSNAAAPDQTGASTARSSEDWEIRLIEAGISKDWAKRLAVQVSVAAKDLGAESEAGLVRGVAIAASAQAASVSQIERGMRDAREVERLLGAFSGELEKLDEVLEVLSAYAQRMRSKPGQTSADGAAAAKKSRRVLH